MFSKKKPPPRRPQVPPRKPPPKKKPFPFFLLCTALFCLWLVFHSVTPTLPKLGEAPRLFANPSRQDLRLTFLHAIGRARCSIDLVMFGLSDPAVLSRLAQKTDEHVETTIYYDPTGSPNVRKALPLAALHPVRQSGLMHQKILILDDQSVFLGSANFTTASLKMHDNLVAGFVSRKIAQFLKERAPHSGGYLRTMVGGQDVELWLLPDPKGQALADLRKKLRSAARTLQIALFTLTSQPLVDEIIRAHKRGVAVTLIIDHHSALGASSQAVARLTQAGIRVLYSQGLQLLHHKFALIDNQTLVMGSANWTQSAFAKNSDLLLTLHNLTPTQKQFMTRLWRRTLQSAKSNPSADPISEK